MLSSINCPKVTNQHTTVSRNDAAAAANPSLEPGNRPAANP